MISVINNIFKEVIYFSVVKALPKVTVNYYNVIKKEFSTI